MKATQPVSVRASIQTPRYRAPSSDVAPLTLQKQNCRPVPRTPEALLQVGGLRADQRGEFAVVLSTGRARKLRLKPRRCVTTYISGGWGGPFWIEHLLKTYHGAQCRMTHQRPLAGQLAKMTKCPCVPFTE